MTDKKETALENRQQQGAKLYSPSTERNRDAIRDVFLRLMPRKGRILEIGGGTGEHAVHLASTLPEVEWRTGDPDETARRSITAWMDDAGLSNLAGPHAIDVTQDDWGVDDFAPFAGIVSINMVHIAPFAAAKGLFAGAGKLLAQNGKLFLYGPFTRHGAHIAPSNQAFDESLKARDPRWGVRDLESEIVPVAEQNGLRLDGIINMPANNFSVVFVKD